MTSRPDLSTADYADLFDRIRSAVSDAELHTIEREVSATGAGNFTRLAIARAITERRRALEESREQRAGGYSASTDTD